MIQQKLIDLLKKRGLSQAEMAKLLTLNKQHTAGKKQVNQKLQKVSVCVLQKL